MVHRAVPIAVLLLALGGCSSGPQAVPETIPAGMAQLDVIRNSDLRYAAVKATVEANGARIAELGRDDAYGATIPAGQTTISARASSPAGRYAISFNAEAGRTYRLLVTPRPEGYAPPSTSGKIGSGD